MRVSTLAAACLLAVARGDYILQTAYGGNTCSGPAGVQATNMGCFPVTGGSIGSATLACNSGGLSANLNVFTDAACKTPASPATAPYSPTTPFAACSATVGTTPASSNLCMSGTFTPPATGFTLNNYNALQCPAASLSSVNNGPVGVCGLTAGGLGPYSMAVCTSTGGTLSYVRRAVEIL